MNSQPRTFALIPAGGQSRRMGRPKLALPVGRCTVLEFVIGALRKAGDVEVVVVVGPHVRELALLAEAAGAHVCLLPEETADMRATVEAGLRWLKDQFHPGAADSWLLVPADHPTLETAVVQQLVAARQTQPHMSIIIPTFQGSRGHPTLIGWKHVAGIQALAPGQGLNAYLREHLAETLELPVSDPEILRDLDTPEDYTRLLER